MGWQLTTNVRFCVASRRVIFLDVARDRYFALPAAPSAAFAAWIESKGTSTPPAIVSRLVAESLLETTNCPTLPTMPSIPPAISDLDPDERASGMAATLEVARALLRVRRILRREGLMRTLDQLRPTARQTVDDDTRRHAASFLQHRRRLPTTGSCLPDSLAMLDFLQRRNAHASIVFGVTGIPFRAHCWVQLGNQILNDQLDHVAPLSPILQR